MPNFEPKDAQCHPGRVIDTQTWLNEHHGSGHGLFETVDAGHPTGTWKTLVCPCGARHLTIIDNDPIAAAVDAQLDPLKDELKAFGHTLAKETRNE